MRPSDYTPELTARILQRIAAGESLRTICQDDDMPCKASVFTWLATHEEFRAQYSAARTAAVEHYEDEILELGSEAKTYIDKEGNVRVDAGDVTLRKLQADNLKWLMSKLAPKKYGDKLELGGNVVVRHEDALDQLDAALRARTGDPSSAQD